MLRNLPPSSVRTLLMAVALALLVQLAESRDLLTGVTRPLVLAVLNFGGIAAQDAGETISIGRLVVPWTRDCAGVNLVLILLALAVWMNRAESLDRRYWGRLLLVIPGALLANVLRVLTLIGYRAAFYPAVESPQMHYFLGLAWLVPFVALVLPRGNRPRIFLLLEAIHAAAVVALLTPMSSTPHGGLIIVAAVLALTHCRMQQFSLPQGCWLLAWGVAGGGIAMLGLESLWLPWLLVCPALQAVRWSLHPGHAIVVAATNPLFLMLPGAVVLSWGSIAWTVWQWLQLRGSLPMIPAPNSRGMRCASLALAALAFSTPFVASSILHGTYIPLAPPAHLTIHPLGNEGFELRLPAQPDTMGVLWFGPTSNDRHHTMKVCLKYRGIEVEPVGTDSTICTDGQNWLYECFLQDQQLLATYPAYLRSTSIPGASPGVHFIFIASKDTMTMELFAKSSQELAATLIEQIEPHLLAPL